MSAAGRRRRAAVGLVASLAAALALAAAGCGVKAPPKPSGAPEKDPPHEIFQPGKDRK